MADLARLRVTQDLGEAVGDVDFVSENIPEDIDLKRAFFRELSRLAKPDAILSTNTSGLSITARLIALRRLLGEGGLPDGSGSGGPFSR